MTERLFSHLDYDDALRKAISVDAAHPFIDIKVLQGNDEECTVGEICGHCHMSMSDYYNHPD